MNMWYCTPTYFSKKLVGTRGLEISKSGFLDFIVIFQIVNALVDR